MKIRSINYFLDPGWPINDGRLQAAGKFLADAKAAYDAAGYRVQTVRLATLPFPKLITDGSAEGVVKGAQELEAACFVHGIDYASFGPVRPGDSPALFDAIPDALANTQTVFASAVIADPAVGISLPAVRLAARTIHRASTISPDGFGNLRFAALANVPAGSPFFPAAYHSGGTPVFAVATEAADLAVSAFADAGSLADAKARLIALVQDHASAIAKVAKKLGGVRGLKFSGIDFSLAPFPAEERSLGTAIERLGVPRVGRHGSLAAAAFIADALDRASFPAVGFSGLLLPQLEDSTLAARSAEGLLTVNELLLYSTVCGTGIDTVALPGDSTPDQLAAILLDLGALALRHNKPLTARLMPIPGKSAGDPISFDFAYFAGSRVLALNSEGLRGLLAGDESFEIGQRQRG